MISRSDWGRPCVLFTILALSLLSILAVGRISIELSVRVIPSLITTYYDLGFGGSYPHRSYISFPFSSPAPVWLRWDQSCDNGLIFLDVNGPAVQQSSPVILDSRGELVWMSDQFDTTTNSRLQSYRNEMYLTFWAGNKAKSSGSGAYYMLNQQYEVRHTVRACGENLQGDLHEFRITQDDTALITVYNLTRADLTSLGGLHSTNGWIVDSIFQEIDIATGQLLFQWRASDHFNVSSSRIASMFAGLYKRYPLDFFHINSVDKDDKGNFLVSSRHLHALIYIDGASGEVEWVLGGDANQFQADFEFHWQHDARWVSGKDSTISLFDNGVAWPQISAPFSRGLLIHVHPRNGTAKLLQSYASMGLTRSSSQGSMQVFSESPLENDPHVIIGWGSSAVFTESNLDGEVLCEMHFGASSMHFWERVKSYRAFKGQGSAWNAAQPSSWSPTLKMRGDQCYVSWNGATTVAAWELQGQRRGSEDDGEFETIDVKHRDHFEESFQLPPSDGPPFMRLRAVALDEEDGMLDYSNTVVLEPSSTWTWTWTLFIFATMLVVVGLTFRLGPGLLWRE